MKVWKNYLFSLVFLAIVAAFALKLGAVGDLDFNLILEVRMPRVILALAIGMGLAVSGASLQALFSNPLCEPYTLGVSSGSALGAAIGISLGLEWTYFGIAGTAFLGAFIFAGILYLISLRPFAGHSTLLLAGVMLGFIGSSLVAVWMAVSEANGLQNVLVWMFGDLSRARIKGALFSCGSILVMVSFIWAQWRQLDALLMGEQDATALGIHVIQIRRRMIILTSIVIALCVSAGGVIGFVGLVVPHFVRRWVSSLHFHLIPLCAIWGAGILIAADCLSRIVLRPYELPVGVVTALVGAPLFLWMMLKQSERAG